jgi:hypothetical protein
MSDNFPMLATIPFRTLCLLVRSLKDYNFACGSDWFVIWSLILRGEHGLSVFKNRVQRRIFGPRKDEVTGGWRGLHNKGFVTCTLRQV